MVLPAPFRPRWPPRCRAQIQADILEHSALCAGIGEGHVLEANTVLQVAPAPAYRRAQSSAAA